MKDKLDDEIKLAGFEALVFEEMEKHSVLYSNRLRTFEDARLDVVTYVEAKFGLRIRDSKPSDTSTRGHSDPVDVDAVNFLLPGKQSSGKGKKSKSWSKSEGKGESKENKGKSKGQSKGQSKGTKGAKGSH